MTSGLDVGGSRVPEQARGRGHALVDVREDEGPRGLCLEGRAPAEQKVQDAAQPVDVGASVRLAADGDLRRRCTRGFPGRDPVSVIVAVRARDLCDPEVEDLHEVVLAAERREKEVLRLDVAVNDPALVRLAERARRLPDDVNGPRRRERSDARRRARRGSRPGGAP